MTAAWAAAAMLDTLCAEVAEALDDEHADRQLIAERIADKLTFISGAFHTAADQADEGEDTEPYCATCGEWIGIFHGLAGWRHFRGDPAPGGHRELYDETHEAAPAWCVPPGRALSPAQARAVVDALNDATAYRLDPAGACSDHLAAELARMLPGIAGEDR